MTNKELLEQSSSRYFSRELSWLAFNDRVLDEAADPTNPLLERLKFLSIVSSNLEEFFMVRVAQIYRLQATATKKKHVLRDGIDLEVLLNRIRDWVVEQKGRQTRLFNEIRFEISRAGLIIEEGRSELAQQVFEDRVLPFIVPVRIPENSPLPHVAASKLHLLAKHKNSYSLIPIPQEVPRLIIVRSKHVFMVDRLLFSYPELIFHNQEVQEIFSFKISRDAEIDLDEDADDPLQDLEIALQGRETGPIMRVEVDAKEMTSAVIWLKNQLNVEDSRKFYQFSLPLDLKAFLQIYNIKKYKKLKFNYPDPQRPAILPAEISTQKFFSVLENHEILLHHPFVSFEPVVELVRNAAKDPSVTRICQTLYRTSGNSPVLEALTFAAKAGKKVTALVEIKARFDEANNIRWARTLEKAGARVIYGTPEIKVHAKVTYVEKVVGGETRSYVHVSTGNYHPKTARLYTDLGLITSDPEFCADGKHLFDVMEQMDSVDDYGLLSDPQKFSSGFKCWSVAPKALHERVVDWIKQEIEFAKKGQVSGIRAKMNGLVEHDVIDALYEASKAGVKIDLIVRGICCLRPGVKGLSENIRVRSIVDKYLEHSRLFIFENGGSRKVWLSSADWMPRNFFKRIELAVPIKNPKIIQFLSDTVWSAYDHDNVRSRDCRPNGIYEKIMPWGKDNVRAQFLLETIKTPEFAFDS